MKRILIIGNVGSGKTTFARKLAGKTKLPLVHLDKLYWRGNWEHAGQEEFDGILQKELERSEWIMDGNFSRTLPHRIKYCDTVFYFDLPVAVCLAGITGRIFQNYGKTREDMGGSCPEYFDRHKISLYQGALTFNRRHRRDYYELLSKAEGVEVIVFRNRRQADRYLRAQP